MPETERWMVGDKPLVEMSDEFIAALDAVIEADLAVSQAETVVREKRIALFDARKNMGLVRPESIDNSKVGFRYPDVFAWRRKVRSGL